MYSIMENFRTTNITATFQLWTTKIHSMIAIFVETLNG